MFRALGWETDAVQFRRAGVRVGADDDDDRDARDEILDGFAIDVRSDALEMARLYTLLFCLENSARQLIEDRLKERFGETWWTEGVQSGVRSTAEQRQRDAESNAWLADAYRDRVMTFVDFGDLAKIITNRWDVFSDLIPDQSWLTQRFSEMERARNAVAHHRSLDAEEFRRLYIHIRDWTRQTA